MKDFLGINVCVGDVVVVLFCGSLYKGNVKEIGENFIVVRVTIGEEHADIQRNSHQFVIPMNQDDIIV